MNKKKIYPLRIKITIIVGAILLLSTLLLTTISIRNANSSIEKATSIVSETGLNEAIPEDALAFPDNGEHFFSVQVPTDIQTEFAYTSLIYMLIISIIGTLLTYLIVRKITQPLVSLNHTINSINANNLNSKIQNVVTNDEVGNLAESFNTMLDKLQKSFESQKSFASNAAHELKTPLATMKTSLQVLNLDQEPSIDDYRKNNIILESCTERLIYMVEELLCLASENEIILNDVISLEEIFDSVQQDLLIAAQAKNITLNMEHGDITIYGNKELITRAIYNLVDNAVKYSKDEESVELFATLNSDYVHIKVKNKGAEIAGDDLDRIFEPFYRCESKKNYVAGNGLGLSIVKNIIEKHKGKINVKSDMENGTIFEIVLPYVRNI